MDTVLLLGDDILDDHEDSYNVGSLKKSEDVRSLLKGRRSDLIENVRQKHIGERLEKRDLAQQ